MGVALLWVASFSYAAYAYAVSDCGPESSVCTFRINVSCPMVQGNFKSGDYAGDFIFWTSRGNGKSVIVDGHFDTAIFDYYGDYSTYICERLASSGRYDFTYLKEINLLDEVKVYFDQHNPYLVDCHFIKNDPTQGTICSAQA